MAIPPLIVARLEARDFFRANPRALTLVNVGLITLGLVAVLPFAIAVFPSTVKIGMRGVGVVPVRPACLVPAYPHGAHKHEPYADVYVCVSCMCADANKLEDKFHHMTDRDGRPIKTFYFYRGM